jgi:hypothetical protein
MPVNGTLWAFNGALMRIMRFAFCKLARLVRIQGGLMKFGKTALAGILSLSLSFSFAPQAHALSQGLEFATVLGAGSLWYGKSKNVRGMRVAGWTLIAAGGTVIAADGSAIVFAAAFMGGMMGSMIGLPFRILLDGGRRSSNEVAPEKVQLSQMVNEIESDAILASNLADDEGSDTLVISSVARGLDMKPNELGQIFVSAKQLADSTQSNTTFGGGVHSVSNEQVVQIVGHGADERSKVVKALVTNYLRMRNVVVEI